MRGGESMEITEIRIFPVHENRLRAYVSITLDDCFVVRDLKIIQGDSGLFVAMPARRREDGTYRDIAHPLNSETREFMERKILGAFKAMEEKASAREEAAKSGGDEGVDPQGGSANEAQILSKPK
jgi:stage V sporulation protein G